MVVKFNSELLGLDPNGSHLRGCAAGGPVDDIARGWP